MRFFYSLTSKKIPTPKSTECVGVRRYSTRAKTLRRIGFPPPGSRRQARAFAPTFEAGSRVLAERRERDCKVAESERQRRRARPRPVPGPRVWLPPGASPGLIARLKRCDK